MIAAPPLENNQSTTNMSTPAYESLVSDPMKSRVYIDTIMDIFIKFRRNIDSIYGEFINFLNEHIIWMLSLSYDVDMYNPQSKIHVMAICDFLKYPEEYMNEFIDYFSDYMRIKNSFKRVCIDDMPMNGYYLYEYFTDIVSYLEYILQRTPPLNYGEMKENNRDFYNELNKYILHPKRIEKMATQFDIGFFDYLDVIMGSEE